MAGCLGCKHVIPHFSFAAPFRMFISCPKLGLEKVIEKDECEEQEE